MYNNKKNDQLKLKLMTNVADKHAIFQRCGQRFEYENMQKQMRKKRDEIEEEERNKMALIDWNDFVVVQTIDFKDDDNLPAPRDLSQAEKANKILFNKNNINPEFAFLLDPQNFQANPQTKTDGNQNSRFDYKNGIDDPTKDSFRNPTANDMPPPRSIMPSFLQKSNIPPKLTPTEAESVTLNVRLSDDNIDQMNLKDHVISLKISTRMTVGELRDRVLEQTGITTKGHKLRHTSYDLLDDDKTIGSYNFLNGTSLELSSNKKLKID